jgi:serine/threonine protein phosphatase PrpC
MKNWILATPTYNQLTIDLSDGQSEDSSETKKEALPPLLLLACDGLWDVIQDQEAVDLALSFNGEKEDAAQFLVEEAMRRGSTDNISVIVAWL